MSKLDNVAIVLSQTIIRFRWWVILLTLLSVVGMASGARFIGFDTDYRVFFSEENPQLKAFDALQTVYTKTDNVLFVLKPNSGNVFTSDVLSAVKEFTEESWKLPFATRVDSITNYQHTYAQGDDLTVIDLVEGDPTSLNAEELRYIRDIALTEPLLVERIISPDGTATGVNITFYFPKKSAFEVPQAAAAARELLTKIQEKHPEIDMKVSGVVMMNNAFSESSQNDMQSLIPLMYGFLLLTMLILLRSFLATFSTLLVIAFSAVAAMGLAGFAGVKLTPPSATAPTIILTLAIADSIHIIISMFKAMQAGMNRREAIIESVRINLQPIFLTSITTAIGFLSLNFSDAPPFHDLGNMSAVGVMLAFFYSILFLPALLSILPIKCRGLCTEGADNKDQLEKFGQFVVNRRRILLPIMLMVVLTLGAMIKKIELNDEFVKYFDYSIPFRADTEFMMDNLTGIYQFEFSLGAMDAQGISDPIYLQYMEEFAIWLRAQPEVRHVYSMTDIFKRLNKNMHSDDPEWYKLPDTREMGAQYLLLYEFSLPYGLDLNDRINVDKSATRLTATIHDMSTVEIRAFKDRSEQWLRDNTPDYMHTEATSPVVMFSYISERNIDSMTKGNIIALILISGIILLALKSVRMGTISLVPNLVPAIMGFGIWGILVGQINMAVAIVAAVSLGIIVDDTVHFLSKYHRARKEKNLSAEEAVQYAFSTVGTALLVTTIILIIGFGILAMSAFQINQSMGLLTAITIGCALIADFLLLPPLLILLDKRKRS